MIKYKLVIISMCLFFVYTLNKISPNINTNTFSSAQSQSSTIIYSYKDGLELSLAQKKLFLICILDNSCNIFKDYISQLSNNDYIVSVIEIEKEPELVSKFNTKNIPCSFIVDSEQNNRKIISSLSSFEKEKYAFWLKATARYYYFKHPKNVVTKNNSIP